MCFWSTLFFKMHHFTLICCWPFLQLQHFLTHFPNTDPTGTQVLPFDRALFSRLNGVAHWPCRPPWAEKMSTKVGADMFPATAADGDVPHARDVYHSTELIQAVRTICITCRGGGCGWVHPAVSSSPAGESYPRLDFFSQLTDFVSHIKQAILITGRRFYSA